MGVAGLTIHGVQLFIEKWHNPSIIAASSGSSTPSIRSSTSTTTGWLSPGKMPPPQFDRSLGPGSIHLAFLFRGGKLSISINRSSTGSGLANPRLNFPSGLIPPIAGVLWKCNFPSLPGAAIQFTAQILRQEWRQPQNLLDASRDRSAEFVLTCSWCKKIIYSGTGLGRNRGGHRASGPLRPPLHVPHRRYHL